MEAVMEAGLEVGAEFKSFSEITSALQTYQNKSYAQYYVKDSRTIKSYLKRTQTKREIPQKLKYTHIVFSCIKGGKTFESKSKGHRPNQRTFKNDCPAEIKLSLGKDGNCLKVTHINSSHNHECSKVGFAHLPQQRRLNEAATNEAVKLLEMRANKRVLQDHLQNLTGKVVTGRDISNIRAKYLNRCENRNDIDKVVKKLRQNEGSTTEIAVDSENNLLGIYYQDSSMKESFAAFPEIVFIDATYKLNELRMPLYIMMGEDGNGQSEIFATFLLASEEKNVIAKMVQIFKEINPDWPKIKSIMSDKDFTERLVLKSEFPDANLLICLFHVLRTIRREVTTAKMGITSDQRNLSLEIIQKMVYAKSEEQYTSAYESLKMTGMTSVVEYFENNWHDNHHEWVEGLKSENLTFLNRTNNRLESLNQKIKEVCRRHASLDEFYHDFMIFLRSTRQAQDHKAMAVLQKRSVSMYSADSPQAKYMAWLTPYAFGFVVQQLNLAANVTNVRKHEDRYIIHSKSLRLKVSTMQCECTFRSAMQLPCRHIFAVRKIEGQDLFCHGLCNPRWSVGYYKSKHAVNRNFHEQNTDHSNVVVVDNIQQSSILSQGQKYGAVFKLCKNLSSIVSEAPMRQFHQQYGVLKQIYDAWTNGQHVGVHFYDERENDENESRCSDIEQAVQPADDFFGGSESVDTIEQAVQYINDNDERENYGTTSKSTDIVESANVVGQAVNPRDRDEGAMQSFGIVEQAVQYVNDNDERDNVGTTCTSTNTLEFANIVGQAVNSTDRDEGAMESSVLVEQAVQSIGIDGQALQSTDVVRQAVQPVNNDEISKVKIPPVIRKRGRPKGADLTVIGLPSKHSRKNVSTSSGKPVPFIKKQPTEKDKIMLSWLLSKSSVKKALDGELVDENEVEVRPEMVNPCIIDENVTLCRLRSYFSSDAWLLVTEVVAKVKDNPTWICNVCKDIVDEESICCDACLSWHHFLCASIKKTPKTKYWFCRRCYS